MLPTIKARQVHTVLPKQSEVPRSQPSLPKVWPVRALPTMFNIINKLPRDELVSLVCPDKYRAWNLLPAREGKAGSHLLWPRIAGEKVMTREMYPKGVTQ